MLDPSSQHLIVVALKGGVAFHGPGQEWSIFKNSDDADVSVFNCASLNKDAQIIHHAMPCK